jgi:hypothetical protein
VKLGTLNIDKVLRDHLPKDYDIVSLEALGHSDFPKIDALYVDWMSGNKSAPTLIRQAAVMDNYARKKIPTVIFDRHLRLTNKEYNWLRKFKVYFFEPAVNYRRKFRYLPVWTKIYDIGTFPHIDLDRAIDLGCIDSLGNKIKAFEKYYTVFGSLYPKWMSCYTELVPEREEEFKELNVRNTAFKPNSVKCSILIGTQKAYEMGYLYPYVFDHMRQGCLPLLPQEHKYFHCLFSDTVIEKMGDINYILEGYNILCVPTLVDIYERVEKYYPEMKVNHTVDVITKCLEG